jgi:hypothetical protein
MSVFVDGRSASDIEEVLLLPETLTGFAARNRLLGPRQAPGRQPVGGRRGTKSVSRPAALRNRSACEGFRL